MFNLAGHHGPGHAFLAEGVDQSRQLPEREPMDLHPWVGGGACIHLRLGFFLDGGDDHMNALSARGVEFTTPPTKQPWGTYTIFKDRDGNQFVMSAR